MDNLLEILVPLIFAAIYFFGHMFSGKSDDDAPAERPARRGGRDDEAAERQRKIQEEIRRKIMERRGESQEGGRSRPPQQAETAYDRAQAERRAAAEQHRRANEAQTEPTRQHMEREAPTPQRRRREPEEGAFSWDQPNDAYGSKMEDKLKQIEATKRRAAKLSKEAKASREKLKSTDSASSGRRGRSREARRPVRSTLTDPGAARVAFIYGEVLGTPVSQKKAATVPGLR